MRLIDTLCDSHTITSSKRRTMSSCASMTISVKESDKKTTLKPMCGGYHKTTMLPDYRSLNFAQHNFSSSKMEFLTGLRSFAKYRKHKLVVCQQPLHARMCGFGEKDRRPIDPPPIVQLFVDKQDADGNDLGPVDPQ